MHSFVSFFTHRILDQYVHVFLIVRKSAHFFPPVLIDTLKMISAGILMILKSICSYFSYG